MLYSERNWAVKRFHHTRNTQQRSGGNAMKGKEADNMKETTRFSIKEINRG
jgi:hypothetical protein